MLRLGLNQLTLTEVLALKVGSATKSRWGFLFLSILIYAYLLVAYLSHWLPAYSWPEKRLDPIRASTGVTKGRLSEASTSSAYRGRRAVLRLSEDKASEAVALLEKAIKEEPNNPDLLTDLSVAYLAKARDQKSGIDLVHAFEAADRAGAWAPHEDEPLYNKALALQGLYIEGAALDAWEIYLSRDAKSPWADYARKQASQLKSVPPLTKQHYVEELRKASINGGVVLLDGLVEEHRRTARVVSEEMLNTWALAAENKQRSEAGNIFNGIRRIVDALDVRSSDPFLADVLSAHAALKEDSGAERNLTQGYILYERGKAAFSHSAYEDAERLYRQAIRNLAGVGSPFLLRVRFALGCALHFQAKRREALEILGVVERDSRMHSYSALLAEDLWMKGLIQFALGELGSSGESYREALDIFEKIGEPESIAGIHFLLVESLDYQGEKEQAWGHCYEALRLATHIADPLRRYQIYSVAATASFHSGVPRLSVLFQDKAVANARLLNNPSALAASLSWRARYETMLNQRDEINRDVQAASDAVEKIPSSAARARAEGDLLLSRAGLYATDNPEEVIQLLSAALTQHAVASARYHRIELLLARARAYRTIGDFDAALRDLKSIIVFVEERRASINEGWTKISFLDRARTVYDEAVSLLAEQGQQVEAFDILERGRARVLLDLINRVSAAPDTPRKLERVLREPVGLKQAARQLPEKVVLLCYGVAGGSVYAWLVDRGGLRVAERIGNSENLRLDVESFTSQLAKQRGNSRISSLDELLYEKLVGKVLRSKLAGNLIVVVPDSFLNDLPFGALRNPVSGRFLLEEYSLGYAASVSTYLADVHLAGQRMFDRRKVLLVGDPAFDRARFGWLENIPRASDELNEISRIYPTAHVLQGESATAENFLKEVRSAGMINYSGHLIADRENPLGSRLILAKDQDGGLGNSSLSARDIYNIKFAKTYIVVLSSCQGAQGVGSESEGSLSITRAFLGAGVPIVISALWKVQDSEALRISVKLHQGLSQGGGPAASLRISQIECLGRARKKDTSVADCMAFAAWGGVQN